MPGALRKQKNNILHWRNCICLVLVMNQVVIIARSCGNTNVGGNYLTNMNKIKVYEKEFFNYRFVGFHN